MAWYVDFMKLQVVRANGFLGSVAEGGAVNFRDVQFNPHGNGTHTECLGHISPEAHSVNELTFPVLMPCLVVSVFPEAHDGDQIITERELALSISQHWNVQSTLPPAIIVRTLPNDKSKVGRNWSNTNPPYFDAEAMTWLVERKVGHLMVDLPSVDRRGRWGSSGGPPCLLGLSRQPTAPIDNYGAYFRPGLASGWPSFTQPANCRV